MTTTFNKNTMGPRITRRKEGGGGNGDHHFPGEASGAGAESGAESAEPGAGGLYHQQRKNGADKNKGGAVIFEAWRASPPQRKNQKKGIIGSIACGHWTGAVPIEVVHKDVLSIGTIWGLRITEEDEREDEEQSQEKEQEEQEQEEGKKQGQEEEEEAGIIKLVLQEQVPQKTTTEAESVAMVVARALIRRALRHLRDELNCHKVLVLLDHNRGGGGGGGGASTMKKAFLDCGFAHQNMMTLSLSSSTKRETVMTGSDEIKSAADNHEENNERDGRTTIAIMTRSGEMERVVGDREKEEDFVHIERSVLRQGGGGGGGVKDEKKEDEEYEVDLAVVDNWRKMWLEVGIPGEGGLVPNMTDITLSFLDTARKSLRYRTIVARLASTNQIVGTVSCQAWPGPPPLDHAAMTMKTATATAPPVDHMLTDSKRTTPTPPPPPSSPLPRRKKLRYGTIWAVYVDPGVRRRGIATALVSEALNHLGTTAGCDEAVLVAASDAGRRVYERLGFTSDHALVCDDLNSMVDDEDAAGGIDFLTIRMDGALEDHETTKTEEDEDNTKGCVEGPLFPGAGKEGEKHEGNDFLVVGRNSMVQAESRNYADAKNTPSSRSSSPNPLNRSQMDFLADKLRGRLENAGVLGSRSMFLTQSSVIRALVTATTQQLTAVLMPEEPDLYREGTQQQKKNKQIADDDGLENDSSIQKDKESDGRSNNGVMAAAAVRGQSNIILETVEEFQSEHGLYVDPHSNWFTRNVKRFGRGFDMSRLRTDEAALKAKFDRLSKKYDHWTVGNRSKVERFTVHCARNRLGLLLGSHHDGVDDHGRRNDDFSPSRSHDIIINGENGRNGTSNDKHRHQPQRCSRRILDVACGIGLQGQTLRLCGYQGRLVGTDVSPGMISRVLDRGCYDDAFVVNLNHPEMIMRKRTETEGFDSSLSSRYVSDNNDQNNNKADDDDHQNHSDMNDGGFDVVICTGAMELLDHRTALRNIARLTKTSGGELWVSFQHHGKKDSEEDDGDHHDDTIADDGEATGHQHVHGIPEERAVRLLDEAGFDVVSMDSCADAFYTPSPKQDGTLLPVPYLFIVATKRNNNQDNDEESDGDMA